MFLALMKKFRGDDFERLAHLKNSLEGEAKGIVKHLNHSRMGFVSSTIRKQKCDL